MNPKENLVLSDESLILIMDDSAPNLKF